MTSLIPLFISLLMIDFQIPQGPVTFGVADLQNRNDATTSIFLFFAKKSGLAMIGPAERINRDLLMAKLSSQAQVGNRSLFYRKYDSSYNFVFTNQARSLVYYGTIT